MWAKWNNSARQFLRSRCAQVTLKHPKIGERILGAHTTLTSRSHRAQMGKNRAQMEKIALLARHEHTMIALFLS